jgi:CheY-like chemotaxis protein
VAGKVLYIEDNPANLRLMEHVCRRRPQISFVGARQAAVGIDLASTLCPDLIMLDLHLPDIPGEEVLARLRDEERTRHIPVAVVSAEVAPAEIRRLRDAGAAAYLTKPMDISAILGLLDTVLSRPLTSDRSTR